MWTNKYLLSEGKRKREEGEGVELGPKYIKKLEDEIDGIIGLGDLLSLDMFALHDLFLSMDIGTIKNLRLSSKKINDAAERYLDAKFWRAVVLGDFLGNVTNGDSLKEDPSRYDDPFNKGLDIAQQTWRREVSDNYSKHVNSKKYWIGILKKLQSSGGDFFYAKVRSIFYTAYERRKEKIVIIIDGLYQSTTELEYTFGAGPLYFKEPLDVAYEYYSGSLNEKTDITAEFDLRVKVAAVPDRPSDSNNPETEVLSDTGEMKGRVRVPVNRRYEYIDFPDYIKPRATLIVEKKVHKSETGGDEHMVALQAINLYQYHFPLAKLDRYVLNYKNRLRFYNITQKQAEDIGTGGEFPPRKGETLSMFKLERERLVAMKESRGIRLWEHDREVPICRHFHEHEELVKWNETRTESMHPCPRCNEYL